MTFLGLTGGFDTDLPREKGTRLRNEKKRIEKERKIITSAEPYLGPMRCRLSRRAVHELRRLFNRMQDPDAETEEDRVGDQGKG